MEKQINMEVTERAAQVMKEALGDKETEAKAIRLISRQSGAVRFRYHLGLEAIDAREDDILYKDDGLEIRMDPESAKCMENVKIDYIDGDENNRGFKFHNPVEDKGWDEPLAQKFQELLDNEVNPGIASHGGFIELMDFKDGNAYVKMGGGCQGCGMAKVTLKEGVEARVRELLPEVKEIIDITDHSCGHAPYDAQETVQYADPETGQDEEPETVKDENSEN